MKEKALELREYLEAVSQRLFVIQNRFLEQRAAVFTLTELKVIIFIGKNDRCIMREIAEHLLIQKNNLTAIVDKLVQKGVVIRHRCDQDRRAVKVSLTPKGIQLYQHEMINFLELSKDMLGALDPDEQEQLLTILRKITT